MDEDAAPAERPEWFSTVGRRGRLSFLMNFLFVNIGIGIITAIAGSMEGLLTSLIVAGCSIGGGWVNICLTAQRLHDMDRSGWLQVIPFLAALLGVTLLASDDPLWDGLGVVFLLAGCLGFSLWLLFTPGTAESNRYGPRPPIAT
ncbi:DUF805 domain-containing protein [Geminicoccus roseus]|uniref:DUF805 domain-containing protein n=1 Tax=Geminicoccus roseus TaxID=404900 RepID=UPI00041A1385